MVPTVNVSNCLRNCPATSTQSIHLPIRFPFVFAHCYRREEVPMKQVKKTCKSECDASSSSESQQYEKLTQILQAVPCCFLASSSNRPGKGMFITPVRQ